MSDHAVRIWVDAAGKLLDDARKHLEADEYFRFVDLVKAHLAIDGRRGPELVIRLPLENPAVIYLDAESDSESDRLRDWLRSSESYSELVDVALALARREREKRNA